MTTGDNTWVVGRDMTINVQGGTFYIILDIAQQIVMMRDIVKDSNNITWQSMREK
jgi:hypothetical protein